MPILEDLTCGEGGSTGATVMSRINLNHAQVGDLDTLTTTAKADLVGAVNEIDAENGGFQTQIDANGVAITANAQAIVDSEAEHGDLTLLTTTAKDSLVNAINEVDAKAIPHQAFYGAKNSAYAVPDAYGADAATLTVTGLVPGRYFLGYSFQADFGANRDKILAVQLTGDAAGDEFGDTISTGQQHEKKNRYYGFYLDLAVTDYEFGIVFRDDTGGLGFIIDYVDLMLEYKGPTP
jgi:hypothetical protein